MASYQQSAVEKAFLALTSGDDGRVCRDIPDAACNDQPGNFFTHVTSLAMTKIADGLIDPKLVLSWLLLHLGASSGIVGLLVPVREAGALLPQLVTAAPLRELPLRKYAWAAGSFVQGACAGGMALAALLLEGQTVGWVVLGLLAILAIARSVCSVTYKDVLGKTVDKSRRGSATGLASTIAAAAVIAFGLLLTVDVFDKFVVVIAALSLAAGLWIVGSGVFLRLTEKPGAREGGGNALDIVRENVSILTQDRQFQWFVITRGLLISTALAPPFMVAAAGQQGSQSYGQLGLLVIASSGAALLSSYVWGRLADRSSRKVLLFSAAAGALAIGLTVVLERAGLLGGQLALPAVLFALMIAYQGVRLGRSTHLIDMAKKDQRTIYTALSNTLIGVLLMLGGLFSLLANAYGADTVLLALCGMSLLAVIAAYKLDEVQA